MSDTMNDDAVGPKPVLCSHTWRVGRYTVTLTVDRRPGAPAPRNVWKPFHPHRLTRQMEAEYQAGLHTAVAKFRAAFGQAPKLPSRRPEDPK